MTLSPPEASRSGSGSGAAAGKTRQLLHPTPCVLAARVDIHHPELRDLLHLGPEPNSVLYVQGTTIQQLIFPSPSSSTTRSAASTSSSAAASSDVSAAASGSSSVYASLSFAPVCLKTGAGLVAAGGQNTELALRPLLPLPGSRSAAQSSGSGGTRSEAFLQRWRLCTPTGGSINNSICIYNPSSSASFASASSSSSAAAEARRALPTKEKGRAGALLFVANNDKSLRCFRLRPGAAAVPLEASDGGSGGASRRLEATLPGLSRLQELSFPTAINHSSLSPDGTTLVAVGDTSQVFLYKMSPAIAPCGEEARAGLAGASHAGLAAAMTAGVVSRTGQWEWISTYAASDASFSTDWSPDGTKFAVASQDGVVSVWDVRSSRCVKQLRTSQSALFGAGAARVVKWSPRGDLLAYTEGCNYFHVVETSTFVETNRLGVPFSADESRPASAGSHASAWARADDEEEMIAAREGESLGEPSDAAGGSRGEWSATAAPAFSWQHGIPTRITTTTTTTSRLTTSDATTLAEPDLAPEAGAGAPAASYAQSGSMAAQAQRLRETRRAANAALQEAWEEALPIVRAYNGAVTPWRNGERLAPWSLSLRRSTGEERTSQTPARNIAGLCWDAQGEHLFVATDNLVARYQVAELRRSFAAPDELR
ncbi:hypothetical protein FA09DRAFT_363532 [Tilletiopsis washingtonensis]|uniref:DUF2415 domain-containing protein n=1 Tax=Tilletiopsis washingtonensis TaxID=58919 RepID=A0A316YYX2_9BASI|nr:hypothetical protein FA09DRAFT_363532 [Tilletiopsis washingtonensis]PWN94660.1 hypothetical protein FA09DRAFT_363532 [Tilletiopsis washingtonensis]